MSNKGPRLRQADKKPQTAEKRKTLTSVLSVVLAIATLLGGLVAIVTFVPRPTIEPNGVADPLDPLSTSFTIVNNSFFPLEDLGVSFGTNQLAMEPAQIDPNMKFTVPFGLQFTTDKWQHHRLLMDERYTIGLGEIIQVKPPARLAGGDIGIIISYKPWFMPCTREKRYRFISHKENDGQIRWYSHP